MSDEQRQDGRKKSKSKQARQERRDEVAARLGMDPAEIAVFSNADGEYAVIKDGTRLLLQDEGKVAWYGDEAPNPTYPLVKPTVELDESELEAVEAPPGPAPSEGLPTEPLRPDDPELAAGAARQQPADPQEQHDALVDAKASAAAEEKAADRRAEAKVADQKPATTRGTNNRK